MWLLCAAAGAPADSGICLQAVRELGPDFPLFGVCMGHQCIGEAFGGAQTRGREARFGSIVHSYTISKCSGSLLLASNHTSNKRSSAEHLPPPSGKTYLMQRRMQRSHTALAVVKWQHGYVFCRLSRFGVGIR